MQALRRLLTSANTKLSWKTIKNASLLYVISFTYNYFVINIILQYNRGGEFIFVMFALLRIKYLNEKDSRIKTQEMPWTAVTFFGGGSKNTNKCFVL